MKIKILTATLTSALLLTTPVLAGETMSANEAKAYFVNIEDGASVTNPVKVIFGLSGMGVAPAGTEKKNTGHHHLFIDRAALGQGSSGNEELNNGIPSDENHKHFGGGQTETVLNLTPGKHTLQLVMGDLGHVPHNKPVVSEVITISVQ